MKKAYIYGWHSKSQIDAINQLVVLKEISVVRWIGDNGQETNIRELLFMPYKLQESSVDIDDKIYARIYKHFPKAIEMYSRVAFTRGLPPQEFLNIMNLYLRYFYADLKSKKPDILLMCNLPHFGVDYIMYLCAKELDIEVKMTFQTLFPNRFFAISSLEDFYNLDRTLKNSNNKIVVEHGFKKEFFYMKKAKQKYGLCYTKMFADFLRLPFDRYQPLTFSGIIAKFGECRIFTKLYPEAIQKNVNISTKYIYFPMQLQPELTTSTLGDIYVDQLLALEQLSSLLPEGWKIYVKENPKQTPRQRREFFFKRLQAIPNVVYLSSKINTHYLIEHSQLVSVVTGTAGWEAISGGKNVLIFGQAWYASLPGVHRYSDSINIEEMSFKKINHTELEAKLNNLLDNAYEGVVNPEYNKITNNYTDDKNKKYMLDFLRKILG